MPRAARKRAARQSVDRHGRDITLRNFESSESGGRETWTETTDSPHTVTARLDRSTRPRPDRDAAATGEPMADVTPYIRDDASGISNLRGGGGEGASEIEADGITYIVVQADNQDNGLYALECERA